MEVGQTLGWLRAHFSKTSSPRARRETVDPAARRPCARTAGASARLPGSRSEVAGEAAREPAGDPSRSRPGCRVGAGLSATAPQLARLRQSAHRECDTADCKPCVAHVLRV